MAGVSNADLARKIVVMERQIAALLKAQDQVSNRFALYWLEGSKAPCFAIRVREDGKGNADLLVVTERLSKPDLKPGKPILKPDDEDKTGKWEPLVLPMAMLIELERIKAEEEKAPKSSEPSKQSLFEEEEEKDEDAATATA